MPPFPKGPKELSKAGYIYLSDSHCKAEGCGALLHWYKYSVTGQKMPIDSITMEPHWKACGGAENFRKKKKKSEPPPDPQLNMFSQIETKMDEKDLPPQKIPRTEDVTFPKSMREPGEEG